MLVELQPHVLEHLARYRQTSCWKREAGGQLFARVMANRWIVQKATGPRKSDWRSRFGFRPDRIAEQAEIDALFAENLHYVGDWHSHPQWHPEPSSTDELSLAETVAMSTHSLVGFLLVIVGTAPFPQGLWVSLHLRGGGHRRLVPIS